MTDDDYRAPDWRAIIAQLRLEAGRIMEDTSGDLALTLPPDGRAREALLGNAAQAARDILALTAAAQVLHRRCLGSGGKETDE